VHKFSGQCRGRSAGACQVEGSGRGTRRIRWTTKATNSRNSTENGDDNGVSIGSNGDANDRATSWKGDYNTWALPGPNATIEAGEVQLTLNEVDHNASYKLCYEFECICDTDECMFSI
jgi:hypothetical protein